MKSPSKTRSKSPIPEEKKVTKKTPSKNLRTKSPTPDKKIEKKTRSSPFRKRPSSRSSTRSGKSGKEETKSSEIKKKDNENTNEKIEILQPPEINKVVPLLREESGLSFEPSPHTSSLKLDEDLSIDFDELESESPDPTSARETKSIVSQSHQSKSAAPEIKSISSQKTSSVKPETKSVSSRARESPNSKSQHLSTEQDATENPITPHSTSSHRSTRSQNSAKKQETSEALGGGPYVPVRSVYKSNSVAEYTHNSRSTKDPPDSGNDDVGEIRPSLSDEVSEMTNPTYVSNKMDPPEEFKKSSASSVKSYRSDSKGSRVSSDNKNKQLDAVKEDTVEEHMDGYSQQSSVNESLQQGSIQQEVMSAANLEDLHPDDDFFGNPSWSNKREHDGFFLTTNVSNDQSTESKDPFEDPFYPELASSASKESKTVSKVSKKARKKKAFDYSIVDDDPEPPIVDEKEQDVVSRESEYHDSVDSFENKTEDYQGRKTRSIEHVNKPKTRSQSPLRIDVNKIKQNRRERARNQSPSKEEVLRRSHDNGGFLGIDSNSGAVTLNVQSLHVRSSFSHEDEHESHDDETPYRSSPGIKLGQNSLLAKNDDGFFRDQEPRQRNNLSLEDEDSLIRDQNNRLVNKDDGSFRDHESQQHQKQPSPSYDERPSYQDNYLLEDENSLQQLSLSNDSSERTPSQDDNMSENESRFSNEQENEQPQKQQQPSLDYVKRSTYRANHGSKNGAKLSKKQQQPSPEYTKKPSYQDNYQVKTDDQFHKEQEPQVQLRQSPSNQFTNTPSFIAKRKNRDRIEEGIREKLQKKREAAEKEKQAAEKEKERISALKAKKRMEDVSKASETGRRRDGVISNSSEKFSSNKFSPISLERKGKGMYRLRRSEPVSPYNHKPDVDDESNTGYQTYADDKPEVVQKANVHHQPNVKVNRVLAKSPVRGLKGSMDTSDRSIGTRSQNSMRVVQSSKGGGPPMRVASSPMHLSRSFSNEAELDDFSAPEKQRVKVQKRRTFKAPSGFGNESGVSALCISCHACLMSLFSLTNVFSFNHLYIHNLFIHLAGKALQGTRSV